LRDRVFAAIEEQLKWKKSIIIAIDGNSGAGKSTLAMEIKEQWDANLFHMDDFFLPVVQKTQERLAIPGGNVDWERVRAEVLIPLSVGIDFTYRPFHCRTQSPGEAIMVSTEHLSIVEGVYSMHPALMPYYSLTVFMAVLPATQRKRILARSDSIVLKRFETEWIPLENTYFSTYRIKDKSDIIIDEHEGIIER